MGHVTLESDIDASEAKKQVIEDAVGKGVAALPGAWVVRISAGPTASRWLVSLERPSDGFSRTMLVEPKDQAPEAIAPRVQQVLRHARVLRPSS